MDGCLIERTAPASGRPFRDLRTLGRALPASLPTLLLTLVLAVLLAGCGSGGGSTPAPPPPVADTTPPSVPAGVTATAVGPTRVDVSWNASTDSGGSGLAGYRVFRGGTQLASVGASTTTYSDTSTAASTQYSYTVRAFDAATPANVSADSAAATVTTPAPPVADTTPPSVPAGVTATAVGPTRVDVSWSASTDTGGSGLAGYRVFRGGVQLASVGASTTTYSDTSAAASTQYSYTVRAFDAATPANVSADSAAVTVTTPAPAQGSGLDARPANASCVAPARPQTGSGVQLVRVYPALSFTSAVALRMAPGDASRWYVVEQAGRVRSFPNTANPAANSVSTFIDITARVTSGGETGLLGIAFHPQWPTVPQVFLSYTRTNAGQLQSVISRFTANAGNATLDPNSEQVLLTIDQPFDNHNGGNILFGPDGYLYAGFGDGGSGGDPNNNAQTLTTLLGKFVRIAVGTSGAYTIPAGNPFAANTTRCNTGARPSGNTLECPEIYAYGMRNPWRWSFDRQTNDLWAGDVGQDTREEVDVITLGANYGWRRREASLCYNPSSNCGTVDPVRNVPLIDPVVEYGRDAGVSVTGGYVYRGSRIADLAGKYVFADFSSGGIFVFTPPSPLVAATPRKVLTLADEQFTSIGENWSAFAEDQAGELYVLAYNGGVYAFQPASGGTNTIPDLLTQTGCVDAATPTQPASGLIPYAPNAPFWSDGAVKQRWIGLPDGSTITPQAGGDWDFPNGTVLVKNFRLQNQLIETRLFMKHPDGVWAGYTYEWNGAQTEATRVVGGKTRVVGSQTWVYPSEAQCLQCHTQAAGRSLGLETAQQNGSFTYPQTGRTANQITTLAAIGVLSPAPTGTLPAYPDPYGTAGTVAERARAWLHTNCSQCHQPGGGTPSTMDLRYSTALASTNACGVAPSAGDLGIVNARLIAPGAPDSSVLVSRINRRDSSAMPPVGSTVVDTAGVALIRQWITGLANCN